MGLSKRHLDNNQTSLSFNYTEKYLSIVKEKLLELSKDTKARIFLFGSRASGTALQGSDIDVGFENINDDEFRRISIQFEIFWEESIVPNKVDLVHFSNVNDDFAKEAKKDIIVWKAD